MFLCDSMRPHIKEVKNTDEKVTVAVLSGDAEFLKALRPGTHVTSESDRGVFTRDHDFLIVVLKLVEIVIICSLCPIKRSWSLIKEPTSPTDG